MAKQTSKPIERHTFTPEELQRMKQYQKESTDKAEIIGLLDNYSASFADWSAIINDAIQEQITKKQQTNEPYEKEQEMLKNSSFFFTKLAYFSETLSDWHKQLTLGNELTDEMIKQGHP
ncbi:MAG: hypothetical protein EZS26_003102 [Candidatus Ordinivivax streblomastigis]|uniref:Uncharacterized protein n=1 Tax=Candidatus Ordinivivax streblomastigis TaxID=2540710 RepID=A0A5M8NWG2_9BACT|nr:MAG: hypothetical protein EZS26_003102 [Candidatus Ordinivivax streblomastigis]